MKYQIFSDNEWIYPDTPIEQENSWELYSARGADVCCQVLTDIVAEEGESISVRVKDLPKECELVVYQLEIATVKENSGLEIGTTKDYESVKHFVTRKAPFELYDITRLIDNGKLSAGRVAIYLRVNVGAAAETGVYSIETELKIGREIITLPLTLQIFNTQIPTLDKANFHMVNWIYYEKLAEDHGVEMWSDEYFEILKAYLENELDMRTDYLMLPGGELITKDTDEKLNFDFDFSHVEKVGNLALSMGFNCIMGGFVARFRSWDDPDNFLLFNKNVTATSFAGYMYLKRYFTRAWECVCKNGWQDKYMQCLVDEPQFPSSMAYRALSGICRKCMPGVKIHDPVETFKLEGAVDVWCVKQETYERYLRIFRELQEVGEEIWLYTCGIPAGHMMNRVTDMPLTVSRMPFWMCCKYDAKGFLHWGYHAHNEARNETCYNTGGGYYPPGNSFVVYIDEKGVTYGVRAHAQRSGAYDAELFKQLCQREGGKEQMISLINRVCRSFVDYDTSAKLLDDVRHELLTILG
ncbi:MAG: DUF4091 domain-containing protein [Oscillospiraceae bacterium]|nr:DUF4091 domain-containing protein [Oscillospiraceae bacterium]